MSKILSLVNPFVSFKGASAVATPRKTTSEINFVPAKARSLSTKRHASIVSSDSKIVQYGVYAFAALNVVMLLGYIISINTSAAAGYEFSKLQRGVASLTEENKKLTLRNAEINSMTVINDTLNQEGFVPVSGAEYIQTTAQHLTQR
ncbi:MAG: hypothetical protein IT410_01015 [Candidatus Doudnabacteria bacterium]|nr:hypothetical protein [Candidatus Doudnabacteria bacterium]